MAQWPPEGNTLPLATFAGGCFWSVELAFQRQPGVVATAVGYTGGRTKNPTYAQLLNVVRADTAAQRAAQVCSGGTGHAEAVQVAYDPKEVSYQQLVDLFFSRHDATTMNRQKNDVGTQYRSAIFTHGEEQLQIALAAKAKIPGAVTEIKPAETFYPAEEYHQQYLEKGGRGGRGQSAAKMCTDPIRCYG